MLYLIDDGAAPTGLTHNIKHMCYKDHAPLELRNIAAKATDPKRLLEGCWQPLRRMQLCSAYEATRCALLLNF